MVRRIATAERSVVFFVFYGTQTALVRAPDEDTAFAVFVHLLVGAPSEVGRLVPPTRDEVTIRRPRPDDRAWIEDSHDPQWITAIHETEVSS